MNPNRWARTGWPMIIVILSLVTNHAGAHAATTTLSGTKWRVHSYSVNDVSVELPFFNSPGERELSFGRQSYRSRLTCVGDRGRFSVRDRTLSIFPAYQIKKAIRCGDEFLDDFLHKGPRYRFSVDMRTLELRLATTGGTTTPRPDLICPSQLAPSHGKPPDPPSQRPWMKQQTSSRSQTAWAHR